MAVVLGLASALVYGAADFMGGLATRRSGAFAVVVWSQLVGLAALIAVVAAMGQPVAAGMDLAWGAAGGIGGGAGVVLLYRGLSVGRMSIVAPTAAVGAATIPVLVGVLLGERPHPVALGGVLLALAAIVLVSATVEVVADPAVTRRRPGLAEAVGAGVGFAAFFICLANTGDDAGLWPLLTARSSILVALGGAAVSHSSLRLAAGTGGRVALVGVLDMGANLLYLLASRQGLLSIVAVLVSLYPASTVLLARIVLRERLSARQTAGLLVAAAGVALISAA